MFTVCILKCFFILAIFILNLCTLTLGECIFISLLPLIYFTVYVCFEYDSWRSKAKFVFLRTSVYVLLSLLLNLVIW